MVHFSSTLHGRKYDAAKTRLHEILTDLEGISPETREQIESISRPSGDGPAPHDDGIVTLYERLILQALAENALARQQAGAAEKVRKAS
jgi:hypothetical protein